MEDLRVSGLSVEEARRIWDIPDGQEFFEYLCAIPGPVRVADLGGHAREVGLSGLQTPMPIGPFLGVPVRHRGRSVGNIHLSREKGGGEFTREDEETLVMFASQVALVVSNARRHRDEQRAKIRLETLVDTSPVGVAVFDMPSGAPVSFNREARRIVDGLLDPNRTAEQLLDVLTVRRADGSEISLFEFPLAETLSMTETVRAEEIVLEVPDGRSVSVLVNVTPIRSEVGDVESVVVTMQDMTPAGGDGTVAGGVSRHGQSRTAHAADLDLGLCRCHDGRYRRSGPCRDAPVPAHHPGAGRQHARPHRRPTGCGPH